MNFSRSTLVSRRGKKMIQFSNVLRVARRLNGINFGSSNFVPKRNLKFATDVKWVRPDKKTVYHPSNSGDLKKFEFPPRDTIQLNFQASEELMNVGEDVKKVFSLQYLPWKFAFKLYKKQLVDKVKTHPYDESSLEVFIAILTAEIRYTQFLLEKVQRRKKKKMLTARVKEAIDKRKKVLKILRSKDYKKFEWILDQLNIVYKPSVSEDQSVTRKTSLVLLAKLRVARQKEQMLGELKKKLCEKKVPFLETKLEKLKWIKEMEEKNNLSKTVTDADIDKCIKKIEEVKIEVAERLKHGFLRKVHPYTLEVYDEKLLLEKEKGSSSTLVN